MFAFPSRGYISQIVLFLFCTFVSHFARAVPFSLPDDLNEIYKFRYGLIETTKGNLVFNLFPENAPWHVANFKWRSDNGYYRNTVFDIYIEDYIIQSKGRRGKGIAAKYYTLPPEFSELVHDEGMLGVARMPDAANPERRSDGRTLHVLLGKASQMDKNYTLFGRLKSGRKVLRSLRKGDMILNVKVYGD